MHSLHRITLTLVVLSALASFGPSPARAEICDDEYSACLIRALQTSTTVTEVGHKAMDCTYSYLYCVRRMIMAA